MTTRLPRGLVWTGTAITAALGVAVIVLRWAGAQPTGQFIDVPGSVALAALLLAPAALSLLALRTGQRDVLLAATVLLVVGAVPAFTLAVVAVLVVVVWLQAWSRWPAPAPMPTARIVRTIAAGLLAVAAVASMFVHVDPACWEQVRDDHSNVTARAVPASEPAGFVWDVDTSRSSGSSGSGSSGGVAGSNVIANGCTSDRITPVEAIISLAFTAAAVTACRPAS